MNSNDLHSAIGSQFEQVFRLMGIGDFVYSRSEGWSIITHEEHPFANFGILSDPSDDIAAYRLGGILAAVDRPAGIMLTGQETDDVRSSLESREFKLVEHMPAMALDLAGWQESTCPEGFTIRAVDLERESKAWVEAMCDGYEVPILVGAMFGHQEVPEGISVEHFAAFKGDRMVATSMSFQDGAMGGVYCVATRAESRRQGLGEAVTGLAVSALRDAGAGIAVLQASRAGTPIYERMGFKSVGNLPLFVRMPESDSA